LHQCDVNAVRQRALHQQGDRDLHHDLALMQENLKHANNELTYMRQQLSLRERLASMKAPATAIPVGGGCGLTEQGSLDCLIKPQSLTVVLAFPPKQVDLVRANVRSWFLNAFQPCKLDDPSHASISALVDLVFHISRDGAKHCADLLRLINNADCRKCFNDVYAIDASIEESRDVYGEGTLFQFYSIWNSSVTLRRQTNYVLWMEPGCAMGCAQRRVSCFVQT
jgi:hypothetical protein